MSIQHIATHGPTFPSSIPLVLDVSQFARLEHGPLVALKVPRDHGRHTQDHHGLWETGERQDFEYWECRQTMKYKCTFTQIDATPACTPAQELYTYTYTYTYVCMYVSTWPAHQA